MNRRAFLRASTGIAGMTAVAGCLSSLGFDTRSVRAPPLVEDRPNAVYYPTHIEGMKVADMGTAKSYNCALTYSFPHRFWIVTGTNRKQVELESEDSVHLMVSLWDEETGIVPPTASLSLDITRNGETVVEKSPWPMLSQNMGFHFGDNIALPGDDTYTVKTRIGPMQTRRTGEFREQFGEPASVTFTFEFSRKELEEITFERLDERSGQKGAVDPMEMTMMPVAQLPPGDDLPGRPIGTATSGDGVFLVRAIDRAPAGLDESGTYLAVSPRTPYNRYPLPFMSLSGTLTRGDETIFDSPLTPTLDPDLNYHYGTTIDGLEAGDTLTLDVGAPPQVARHEGYETAFFEMEPMELTV